MASIAIETKYVKKLGLPTDAPIDLFVNGALVGQVPAGTILLAVDPNVDPEIEVFVGSDALDDYPDDDVPEAAALGDADLDDDGIPLSSSEEPPHSS